MKRSVIKIGFKGKSIGVNSEWVRQSIQNVFAHGWAKPQRMFPMLSNDWDKVYNISNLESSKFSIWSK